jgi:endonuclease-8
MPEGPSIVILKEQLEIFKGCKVISVNGNAKIDLSRISNLRIIDFKSWGKHFLICFKDFFLRIHLLMFGTYRINERKEMAPRLSLCFENGELNFYSCSIKLIEGDPEEIYDWQTDIMSNSWNVSKAEKACRKLKNTLVCDALLNQNLFSGVGNIIKNEVLFRTRIHPESLIEGLPVKKLKELVKETRNYSLDFYKWKKAYELKKHWLIYRKKQCPRCNLRTITKYIGTTQRLTCFCAKCQLVYPKLELFDLIGE